MNDRIGQTGRRSGGSWARRVLRGLLVVAVWSFCTGFQWDVVQVFAWVKMFAENSSEMSYTEAAALTFAPEGACEICEFVSSAKQDEREDPALAPDVKEKPPLVLVSVEGLATEPSSANAGLESVEAGRLVGLAPPVPTPPPRIG